MSMETKYDCLIIGLGPVGALLGNLLGKFGLSVCILERERKIFPNPRAVHGDDEMLRTLQSIGLLEKVLPTIQPFDQMELLSGIYEQPLIQIDVANPDKPNGFPTDFWFFQPELEKILREGLSRFPKVHIIEGAEVKGITQSDNQVEVSYATISSEPQNPTENNQKYGKYLIGCDGGNSFTRKAVGGNLRDLGFHQKWLVIDAFEKKHQKQSGQIENLTKKWGDSHQQIINPKQPMTYVAGVRNHRRWEIMETSQPETREGMSEKMKTVLKDLNLEANYEILRQSVYTFHALIAEKWQFNQVLLCGDAAHQMPPFLGQGLCSGFRDAENLAWKIALILHRKNNCLETEFSKKILKTYQSERYLHTFNLIKGAIILGKIIQTKNPFVASVRNLALRLIRNSQLIKYRIQQEIVKKENLKKGFLQSATNKLIGSLFPQFTCHANGNLIYSDGKLGTFFTLVSIEKISDFGNYKSHYLTYLLADDEGLKEWFRKNKTEFVIVRPDKRIFACGKFQEISKAVDELNQWIFSEKH